MATNQSANLSAANHLRAQSASSVRVPLNQFGAQYLLREFGIARERASAQVAVLKNRSGIDGFHFDENRRNLYLYQFNQTETHTGFKESLAKLIEGGVECIFTDKESGQIGDQLLIQLKSCLAENQSMIDRICVHLVYVGNPDTVDRSKALEKLREDLENKKYIVDKYFERPVAMVIEVRSAKTRTAGLPTQLRKSYIFPLKVDQTISCDGPNGERMVIGSASLSDLCAIYSEMGTRFFERNIRSALSEHEPVNRSIRQAIKEIVVEKKQHAAAFMFNHNGVTLSAESVEVEDSILTLTEPRLLNGAQTVTTAANFLREKRGDKVALVRQEVMSQIRVMCRVITSARAEFVTTVTINNNRQSPVHPWNLHANDMVQLELQDKFRDDLGLYYERQEHSFQNLDSTELADGGITQFKPLDMQRLARTLLASDGRLEKVANLREVFDDERMYLQVFDRTRLRVDLRRVILCYKIQFCLSLLLREIADDGTNKYAFAQRARSLLWALLCQAILNDPDLGQLSEQFGKLLGVEASYKAWLVSCARSRCRVILCDLIADKVYQAQVKEEDFSFLRTNAAFKRSVAIAQTRFNWTEKHLR